MVPKVNRPEDVYVVDPPIFAIADGMGGAKAGEVAAALAADALRGEGGSGEDTLVTLIQEANRRVYERAAEDTAKSGMGTTPARSLARTAATTPGAANARSTCTSNRA